MRKQGEVNLLVRAQMRSEYTQNVKWYSCACATWILTAMRKCKVNKTKLQEWVRERTMRQRVLAITRLHRITADGRSHTPHTTHHTQHHTPHTTTMANVQKNHQQAHLFYRYGCRGDSGNGRRRRHCGGRRGAARHNALSHNHRRWLLTSHASRAAAAAAATWCIGRRLVQQRWSRLHLWLTAHNVNKQRETTTTTTHNQNKQVKNKIKI